MIRALIAAVLVVCAAACTDSGGNSSLLPTRPSLPPTVDTFTGTVNISGQNSHTFMVTTSNQPVSVTLTAAGPPPTISMGVGVGVLAVDGSCSVLSNAAVVTSAGTAAQLAGTIASGTYCVAVFDVGNQTAPVDYSVNVAHY